MAFKDQMGASAPEHSVPTFTGTEEGRLNHDATTPPFSLNHCAPAVVIVCLSFGPHEVTAARNDEPSLDGPKLLFFFSSARMSVLPGFSTFFTTRFFFFGLVTS